MNAGFEVVAHPSDVGFRAHGPDMAVALCQAVAALAAIVTGDAPPDADAERAVHLVAAEGIDTLLVLLLEECLFLVDTEDWLATSAVLRCTETELLGVLRGGGLTEASRADGVHVKAITWHQLEAVADVDGVRLQVFVDL